MASLFRTLRRAAERGHANHGWLDSYHTFSFASYYDPAHMGYRTLRVINEDRVGPGEGFGSHPHRDMEILSYVVSGALRHKDSMGNESVIAAGDVQKITAGSGIVHSEFNASDSEPVHFLQIWILPRETGLTPSYQEFTLPSPTESNPLHLFGVPTVEAGLLQFNQDVFAYRGVLKQGQAVTYQLKPSRGCWVQIVSGVLGVGGEVLGPGDGGVIELPGEVMFAAQQDAEFLVLDIG